jgi:hypothetical protein
VPATSTRFASSVPTAALRSTSWLRSRRAMDSP